MISGRIRANSTSAPPLLSMLALFMASLVTCRKVSAPISASVSMQMNTFAAHAPRSAHLCAPATRTSSSACTIFARERKLLMFVRGLRISLYCVQCAFYQAGGQVAKKAPSTTRRCTPHGLTLDQNFVRAVQTV